MCSPPYNGIQLQEKLDVILTTAAFDQKVALLFLDDGVFQLKKGQEPGKKGFQDTLSVFGVMEMYDINDIYIETESMEDRGLKESDLGLALTKISRGNVGDLMKLYDVIT